MTVMLLTKYNGSILGPIDKILGYLMNWIFIFLDKIGIPNIGLAIILFTIVIYMLLLPLTIKQQKFSKLSAKMSPELKAIQKKYEGKKDNESMQAMNLETQEIYAKYGVSPSGSCVQLLIQMPILFALYRVIYAIPAYVPMVKNVFSELVGELYKQEAQATEFLKNLTNSSMYSKQFTNELFLGGNKEYITNTYIDCLNRASSADWVSLKEKFSALSSVIDKAYGQLEVYNNFLGLNVSNSPSFTIKTAFAERNWLLIIGALLVPLLAGGTQWLNTKLMPQAASNDSASENDTMAQSMKAMNTTMPIMSAVFCLTLPVGMGIYWIAGAVIRCVQQVIINKHLDKIDIDEIVEKNKEKAKAKMAKKKEYVSQLNSKATINTKNIGVNTNMSQKQKEEALSRTENSRNNAKPGSLAEKANLVKQYNERNNK